VHFIYIFTRTSSIKRYLHKSKKGHTPWAIITGASDGIGKAYAHLLAAEGLNLVIHGRNISKLQAVQKDLQASYPQLQFRIFVCDASESGPEVLKRIEDFANGLEDLHVTVLINNVGGGQKLNGPMMQAFHEDVPGDIDGLINLNARFLAQITHAVLPHLLAHSQPSLILTMGSISDIGTPYVLTYSSSKAFDLPFSKGLKREMIVEGRNVEVLGIMVGEVTDVGWDRAGGTLMKPTSGTFAKAALQKVGCGEDVVAAWWVHGLVWWAVGFMSDRLLRMVLVQGITKAKSRQKAVMKEK